jgi:acyl-CoA reductase-like NAD-dependent aldehyde dehydrogenase
MMAPLSIEIRKQNIDTMNAISVDVEISDKLKKAKLEDGFYNLIDGERVSAGKTLSVVNPATGNQLAMVPDIDRVLLNKAVSAARKAFSGWRAVPFSQRRAMLTSLLDKISEHGEELIVLLTAERGGTLAQARWEIDLVTKALGPAVLQMEIREEEQDVQHIGHITKRYTPIGVVGAISPWNMPVFLSFTKVLPALLVGNTVVLKPSPFTPLTVLRISDYVHELLPPGVFNVVTGGDDLGPWITSHPGINLITFTGSTLTGKRVLESAAATLKRVTLELGGNDPGIVLSDAEPEKIAQALFDSMFLLGGQGCISLKRLYVHEDIYSRVIEALVAIASATKVGDGFDPHTRLGPVQNHLQYKRLQSVWDQIKRSGAKVLFRGVVPTDTEGLFFPVTLLDNPPDDASFVTEEVFGPIRSIFKYENLEEVIRRANNTSYGLGASVWGSDPVRLRAVASLLEAGTVWINQHAILNPLVPASAYKESGLGVEFGLEGLQSFCNLQVIAAKQ